MSSDDAAELNDILAVVNDYKKPPCEVLKRMENFSDYIFYTKDYSLATRRLVELGMSDKFVEIATRNKGKVFDFGFNGELFISGLDKKKRKFIHHFAFSEPQGYFAFWLDILSTYRKVDIAKCQPIIVGLNA